MAASVSIMSKYVPLEVDLWGAKYETKELGRKASKRLRALKTEITEFEVIDDESMDAFIAKVAEWYDAKLKPVKGKVKPSTLIKKHWEAEDLSELQLASLMSEMSQQEVEINRPS